MIHYGEPLRGDFENTKPDIYQCQNPTCECKFRSYAIEKIICPKCGSDVVCHAVTAYTVNAISLTTGWKKKEINQWCREGKLSFVVNDEGRKYIDEDALYNFCLKYTTWPENEIRSFWSIDIHDIAA